MDDGYALQDALFYFFNSCFIRMWVQPSLCSVVENSNPDEQLCHFDGLFTDNGLNHNAVLLVHGMGYHSPGWSESMRSTLVAQTGFEASSSQRSIIPHTLKSYDYTRIDGNVLRFYELTWSSDTISAKSAALRHDLQLDSYRSSVNRKIKTGINQGGLINDKIADAIYYLGPGKLPLRDKVTAALTAMHVDLGEKYVKLALISNSLGSRIVFDALNGGQDALTTIRQGVTDIYMLANQLPLLRLGMDEIQLRKDGTLDIQSLCQTTTSGDFQWACNLPIKSDKNKKINVTAFTDANDLLSYGIPPYLTKQYPHINFVNVYVNVAKWSIFGVTNPIKAHLGYERDLRVVDHLINGGSCQAKI